MVADRRRKSTRRPALRVTALPRDALSTRLQPDLIHAAREPAPVKRDAGRVAPATQHPTAVIAAGRVTPRCLGRGRPVSYMSPGNPAPKSCNLVIGNWLLVILEGPLSRPPDYSVSYRASHLDGNRAGYSPDHFPDSPESYLDCCLPNHPADHLPRNLPRYRGDHLVNGLPGHRADCLANHLEENPAGNPAGNLLSNGTDCLVDSPVNHPPGNRADHLPGPAYSRAGAGQVPIYLQIEDLVFGAFRQLAQPRAAG